MLMDPERRAPEKGRSKPALNSGRARRKRLRDLRWSDIKALFNDAADGWSAHNCPRLGAALAFYTLLSITPLLLILISIAGLVFGAREAHAGLIDQLNLVLGSQRAKIIDALIEGAKNRTGGYIATLFGLVTLLFGASGAVTELREDMNGIWGVTPRHASRFQSLLGMAKERLWAFAFVLGMGLALTLVMMIAAAISALASFSVSLLPHDQLVLHSTNAAFSFCVLTCLFAAVFAIIPEAPVKWSDVFFGAAVTALLFIIGNLALSWYLGRASFASTYGAAASVVVLAVWVYYSAQIFFLGVELTRAFAQKYGSHSGPRAAAG